MKTMSKITLFIILGIFGICGLCSLAGSTFKNSDSTYNYNNESISSENDPDITPAEDPFETIEEGEYLDITTEQSHPYSIVTRDNKTYLITFLPTPLRSSFTDIEFMTLIFRLINTIYGTHTIENLVPEIIEVSGVNIIRFQAVNGYYYINLLKEDTGEVYAISIWLER